MGNTIRKIARVVALTSLLAVVFLAYCNFLDDPDLWWHLKTGEYICQNHRLPTRDHFSFTSETPDHLRTLGRNEQTGVKLPSDFAHWSTNLTHSWGGQVLFYLAYLAGGFVGVALLKSAVFVAALLLTYLTMRRNGSGFLLCFALLAQVALIGRDYDLSRPQVFSFFFMAALVYLLSDYRRGGRQFYLLPAMMLVWANLHAGFVVGTVSLLAYVGAEVVPGLYARLRRKKESAGSDQGADRTRALLLVALSAAAAGLINPNGYKIYLMALQTKYSLFSICITEYWKPALYENHPYWLMALLCVAFLLISLRSMKLSEIVFVAFLLAGSLSAQRMIIFFALGSASFLARAISVAGGRIASHGWFRRVADSPTIRSAASCGVAEIVTACLATIILVNVWTSGQVGRFGYLMHYPDKAVQFLQANRFPGNLFNQFNWGGYLIWSLPQYPVFIDGRCLNETSFFHYLLINTAAKGDAVGGIPLWKRLVDAYRIELVLTPVRTPDGLVVPLVDVLYRDPAWELVYHDGTAVVFVKGSGDNRQRFGRLFLIKTEGLYRAITAE